MNLDLSKFKEICSQRGAVFSGLSEISLAGMDIADVDDLAQVSNLHKLNLKDNSLCNAGLRGLSSFKKLTLLNLSGNKLDSMKHLEALGTLLVLNLSHNKIHKITIHLHSLVNLKALILNNNHITCLENLDSLTTLTTLEINNIHALSRLLKLSATHNNIHTFPKLINQTQLKELRLSENKIKSIPQNILDYVDKGLEILDLGHNLIPTLEDLAGLKKLVSINQLNLKGNPVCSVQGYKNAILEMFPLLRVLDGERFDERFCERKKKRQVMRVKKSKREIAAQKLNSDSILDESKIPCTTDKAEVINPERISLSYREKKRPVIQVQAQTVKPLTQVVLLGKDNDKLPKRANPFDEIQKTKKQKQIGKPSQLDVDADTINVNEKSLSGVVSFIDKKKTAVKSFDPAVLGMNQISETLLSAWD